MRYENPLYMAEDAGAADLIAGGRVQKYRIVGEDEADPKAGSISFVSPVATLLMGKAFGDEVGACGQKP